MTAERTWHKYPDEKPAREWFDIYGDEVSVNRFRPWDDSEENEK